MEDHDELLGVKGNVFRPHGLVEDSRVCPGPIVRGPGLSWTLVAVAQKGEGLVKNRLQPMAL